MFETSVTRDEFETALYESVTDPDSDSYENLKFLNSNNTNTQEAEAETRANIKMFTNAYIAGEPELVYEYATEQNIEKFWYECSGLVIIES